MGYMATAFSGQLLPADVLNAYEFTIFFLSVSVISYVVSKFKWQIFLKSFAISAILTCLVFPLTIGQATLTIGNALLLAGIFVFDILLALGIRYRSNRVISKAKEE